MRRKYPVVVGVKDKADGEGSVLVIGVVELDEKSVRAVDAVNIGRRVATVFRGVERKHCKPDGGRK